MSFSVVDHQILHEIANNIHFATGPTPAQLYYYPCCRNLLATDIQVLINTWHRLNLKSVDLENNEMIPIEESRIALQFNTIPANPYQFLKWLIYLQDNIDFTRIRRSYPSGRYLGDNEDANTLIFLKMLISNAMTAIIESLPKYQDAKYGTY